jgi:hypothetical protein
MHFEEVAANTIHISDFRFRCLMFRAVAENSFRIQSK